MPGLSFKSRSGEGRKDWSSAGCRGARVWARGTMPFCYGMNCVPPNTPVGTLTPSNCECDFTRRQSPWARGYLRQGQIGAGRPLTQHDRGPYEKGRSGQRRAHRGSAK